jgi:N-methylhydantoinase A
VRIAIDTGGTFTDCVYFADGRLQVLKIPSTPADPGQAVEAAVVQIAKEESAEVRHGTTVGTNALLERKGARVAFVTTAGFEDSIAIGRQARPKLYDLCFTKEPSLAPENLRFGVDERVSSEGTVLRAVTESELSRLRDAISAAHPEAIAVSLLFSFANPENELSVVSSLRSIGVPVSASHEILPEFREFERGSTVLINAYLAPKMERYLRRLDQVLAASNSSLHVMQSSGGIIPAAVAAREPVRTVLSGPAGGVVGAVAIGKDANFNRILTFDMGGTSTDVSLVELEAGLRTTTESVLLGLPIAVPMLRIHTVGAGGGSLAGFDRGGALKVGPESAGADPGPVCYGHGEQPTVTDANLLLGRLDADSFLGGRMKLNPQRSRDVMERCKGPLPTVESFAEGIVRVADSHMQRALRHISVESGHDPREFTLVSFGGAGPLHACALAQSLQIPRVLIPPMPGALSAYGILVSDITRDYSRTVMLSPNDVALHGHLDELQRAGLEEMAREGIAGLAHRTLDLRYVGQGYELTVDWSPDFVSKFHETHESRYGYADKRRSVEVVNVRLRMVAPTEPIPMERIGRASSSDSRKAILKRTQIFYENRWVDGPVYDRIRLQAGHELEGPAIVVEYSGTTFIPPEAHAHMDEYANILVQFQS